MAADDGYERPGVAADRGVCGQQEGWKRAAGRICDYSGLGDFGDCGAGGELEGFAATVGRDCDWSCAGWKAGAGSGFAGDRWNDGAAGGGDSAESGTDDGWDSGICACGTFWEYRAWNEQRDFARDGVAFGRLRGE